MRGIDVQTISRLIKTIFSSSILPAAILLAMATLAQALQAPDTMQTDATELAMSRNYYMSDLLQPHRYTPGKNSFLYQTLHKGERKTVLELAGRGSVRHLWSTWSIPGSDAVPTGRVLLRVFVDKQATPSIVGTIDEICRAAQATGTNFVPFPAFIYKDAYNFYLPIHFTNGIRIEIEALDEINEFYTQIDYRLDPTEKHSARLVSEATKSGLVLKYTGNVPSLGKNDLTAKTRNDRPDLQCSPSSDRCEFTIAGPGVIRKLTFRGELPSDLQLEIYWDDDTTPGVQAPIKYLFADFVNAAIESKPGEVTSYFPMPFHHSARVVLKSASASPARIAVQYAIETRSVSKDSPYFHALYHDNERTLGYSQYAVLQIRGKGLFVGMNLFDSGHNHGGGDAALIDGGSDHPQVLHGICGEDYFGFAWHHVGTMTPLTGAPVHERRYRLHLENPYPFSESFQLLFGIFANMHPKSVAFWYQFPPTSQQQKWIGLDAPWKVLGPLSPDAHLPSTVSSQTYETTVAINKATQLTARWQDASMISGFLDLTYQFRHYVLIESGSGFVAGASKTKLTTYVYSDSDKTVSAILGHDDEVVVQTNGATLSTLPQNAGFASSYLHIPLHAGWNTLDLVLSNDENTNWRWSGLAFVLQNTKNSESLKFSTATPSDSSAASTSATH